MGLLLALFACAGYGVSDYLAGVTSRRIPVLGVLLVSQMVGLALMTVVVTARFEPPPSLASAGWALLASATLVGGLGTYWQAMAVERISIVAPITAMSSIIPVIWGVLHGEPVRQLEWIGIMLTLLGVALIAQGPPDLQGESTGKPRSRADLLRGLLLATVASVLFGSFFVAQGAASADDAVWASFLLRVGEATLVLCAIAAVRYRPVFNRRTDLRVLVVIGLLDAGANLSFTVSSTMAHLGVVSVITAANPLITIILAQTILRERLSLVQRLGVAVTLTGAFTLAGS